MTEPTPRARQVFRYLGTAALVACTVAITLGVQQLASRRGDEHGEDEHGHHGAATKEPGHGDHGEEHEEHEEHEGRGTSDEHVGHGARLVLSDEARKNAKVELGVATPGRIYTTVPLPGEITLNQERLAHVTPRIGGVVKEVKAQLGEIVKKGDVLAVLESKELAEFGRDARAANERVKLAEANFKRIERLYEDKIVPEKELLAAKQALSEAKIDRDAAGQTLVAVGATGTKSTYNLVAPLDGTVIEKHCAIGEVLKDDTRTFVIADITSVWVELQIYPKDLARIEVGQDVRVRGSGIADIGVGKLAFIGAVAQSSARSVAARAVLDNSSGRWKPGLFVSADVGVAVEDATVVVQDSAVMTIEGKSVVFVDEDGGFEARPVKLGGFGRDDKGNVVVEIMDGVAKGDSYVTNAFVLKAELGKSEAGHEH